MPEKPRLVRFIEFYGFWSDSITNLIVSICFFRGTNDLV